MFKKLDATESFLPDRPQTTLTTYSLQARMQESSEKLTVVLNQIFTI